MVTQVLALDFPTYLVEGVQALTITSKKVDEFTDTMIEDIQDIIKVEMEGTLLGFKHGILPPRFKEIKDARSLLILGDANYNFINQFLNSIFGKKYIVNKYNLDDERVEILKFLPNIRKLFM